MSKCPFSRDVAHMSSLSREHCETVGRISLTQIGEGVCRKYFLLTCLTIEAVMTLNVNGLYVLTKCRYLWMVASLQRYEWFLVFMYIQHRRYGER